ncbi:hypothetical protein SRHO_G00122390 [Serrasalmus rhombeus]
MDSAVLLKRIPSLLVVPSMTCGDQVSLMYLEIRFIIGGLRIWKLGRFDSVQSVKDDYTTPALLQKPLYHFHNLDTSGCW